MKPSTFVPALLLLGAIAFVSCVTPPVVASAHNAGWTLQKSGYPKDARSVEILRPGDRGGGAAPALRGLFFPSDDGAPVVVHFAESGASLTSSIHGRGQYHALAELGFASLVVDYRGVGLSDGEPSPRELGEDALAIWEEGLNLVDGDAGRLLVRGVSLGTVAASSLLAAGIEPAACVAFAPVRPQTVARLYGYALYWDPLVWLVAPWLRTFSGGDPLKWFTKPGAPRLVVISPEDELLGERDFERLKRGVEQSGGMVEVPEGLFVMILNDDPVMQALGKHIALTQRSFSVHDVESEFLKGLFPSVPDVSARLERIERLGSSNGVAALQSNEAMRKRLRAPLLEHRLLPPNVALAAAYSLHDEEMAHFDGWLMKPFNKGPRESFMTRSYERLIELFDLEDPGGRLPIHLVVQASKVLGAHIDSSGGRRWSAKRIDALVHSILGDSLPGRVFLEGGDQLGENEPWRFGVSTDDRVRYAEPGQSGQMYLYDVREAFAADAKGRSEVEARRRLHRCFMKAAGLKVDSNPR